MNAIPRWSFALVMGCCGAGAWCQGAGTSPAPQSSQTSLLDLDLDALTRLEVRSATGFRMSAREAPAVVSVITSQQMAALGAWTVEEALQGVPGLHVSAKNRNALFVIRGMYTFDNPQVLVTLNDVPVNEPFSGALGSGLQIPLSAVERVEVVRGPGSAVFGADAFAGVLNIVTRDPLHEPESAAGVSLGDFRSGGWWVRKTTRLGEWGLMAALEGRRTSGDRGRVIPSDLQTFFDQIFGSRATLAPGPLDTQHRSTNLHVELARSDLQLRLWHYRADGMGAAWGAAGALDPASTADSRQTLMEMRYTLPGSSADSQQMLQASWTNFWYDSRYHVFPAGAVLPVNAAGDLFGPGASLMRFDEGVIGNPGNELNIYRLGWEWNFKPSPAHRWRLALGAVRQRFHAWEAKNFSNGGHPGQLLDVTGTPYVYAPDLKRSFRYVSVQDVWRWSPQAELTLGVRADDYSDFGRTINPRASLVWQHGPTLSSKWLYGRAFRAPSMKEQYVASNPVNIGSKTLKPETVQTWEWQLDWTPSAQFSARLALFRYAMRDLIRLTSGVYRNVGSLRGPGAETELEWRPSEATRLGLVHSLQRAHEDQGQPAPYAPRQTLQLSLDQRLGSDWQLNVQQRFVGQRPREPGNDTAPLPSYRRLDLNLRHQPPGSAWSWSLGLRNALNQAASEPVDTDAIPGDAPQAGRQWRLDARVRF